MAEVVDRKRWVVVGRVVRAHGIQGALRVLWYSPLDALVGPVEQVLLTVANAPGRSFVVETLRPQGDEGALMQLVGVTTVDEAVTLRGAEVRVPRALIPAAAAGEVYLFELLGRDVYDAEGRLLGRAQNLYDYGAGPLLGILPPLVDGPVAGSAADGAAADAGADAAVNGAAADATVDVAAAAFGPAADAIVAPSAGGGAASPRSRRGRRKRGSTARKRDEVLLPLLPRVLRELDLEADRVVVDTRLAGIEPA